MKFRKKCVLHFISKIEISFPEIPDFSRFDFESLFKFYVSKKFLLLNPKVFNPLLPNHLNKVFRKAAFATLDKQNQCFTIFDPWLYFLANQDVKKMELSPWIHFLSHGRRENRVFNVFIDSSFLKSQMSPGKEFDVILDYLLEVEFWELIPSKFVDVETFRKVIKTTDKPQFPVKLIDKLFRGGAYDTKKYIIHQLSIDEDKEQLAAYTILNSRLSPIGSRTEVFYSPTIENLQIDSFVNQDIRIVPQCAIFSQDRGLVLPAARFDQTYCSIAMPSGIYYKQTLEATDDVSLVVLSEFANLDILESIVSSQPKTEKLAILPHSIQQEVQLEAFINLKAWENVQILKYQEFYDFRLNAAIDTPNSPFQFREFSELAHESGKLTLVILRDEEFSTEVNKFFAQNSISNSTIIMSNINLVREFLIANRNNCEVVLSKKSVEDISFYLIANQTFILDENF